MGLLPGRVAIALPGRLWVPPAERARKGKRPGAAHQGVGTARKAVHQLGRLRGPPALAGPSVTTRTRAATADGLWLGLRIRGPWAVGQIDQAAAARGAVAKAGRLT